MATGIDDNGVHFGQRYTLGHEIGRGGMATVYLATDTTASRQVAIKVLHPELAVVVGAERFHREIQIASSLAHPNILPVFDSGEEDGKLFYVMPLVQGESLRARLDREGQLSVEQAVDITCEIASALQFAHDNGIVHRDVKPENILLENGHALLADFGIARVASSVGDSPKLTQTGMSLGTPTYMSPEQAMGERSLDGRSDEYSLACVTYEMLAGEPPFTAPTIQALIARHLSTPVPLISTVRPVVCDDFQDVILQALEKVPADRHPTVSAFAALLSECAKSPDARPRRTAMRGTATRARALRDGRSLRPHGWRVWALGGTVLVLTAALATWQFQRHAAAGRGAADGVDAKRVAVLYFEDLSPTHTLAAVADGLTEGLIGRLRDVQSLSVVSRDGVARYRKGLLAVDSVARLLKVGTVVTGSVEPDPAGIRVSLRLLDGSTGTDFRRASFVVANSAMLSAGDSVAEATSRMLRKWTGEELRLKEEREATRDVRAWSLFQLAERSRKVANDVADTDSLAAARGFVTSDSLLALAEARDSSWSQPSVLRGRIALRRAQLATTAASQAQWLKVALGHAEHALRIDPRSADALELRGTVRYERFTRNLSADPAEEQALVHGAEADLVRATEINPGQASAWNVLSALDYKKEPPDISAANIHARRALEADAYLEAADEVIWRLLATSYDLGQHDQALKWCDEGHRRVPTSARFVKCRLYIGLMRDHPPDVNESWKTVQELVALTPPARRPLVEREARMLASVSLVYTGKADSARHVLLSARADRSADPDGALLGAEALVRARLGDHAETIRLVKLFISEHPQHRAGLTRNTWWWKDLENDPEWRAIVGARR